MQSVLYAQSFEHVGGRYVATLDLAKAVCQRAFSHPTRRSLGASAEKLPAPAPDGAGAASELPSRPARETRVAARAALGAPRLAAERPKRAVVRIRIGTGARRHRDEEG